MSGRPIHNQSRAAFTLIEVMVVVAIIGILVSLVVMALGGIEQKSYSTLDAANQRSLMKASIAYTTEHEGMWLNAMTSGASDTWVDCYGSNIGPGNAEKLSSLTEGEAWPYLGEQRMYKSPEDTSTRVRSYSLNSQVGVRYDGYHVTGGFGPATQTMGTIPMPGQTLLTISEHSEYGYNPQGFYVGIPGTGWEGCWVDFPAYWNPKGVNVGYVDGSVRFYNFVDPNLPELVNHASTWGVEGPDLTFFANIMFPGWDQEW
jgi:prepilin-type N-terminal cleavage/methylation domain-containing protein/prepilin-type processing-associated H-X9-DG protein